MHFTSRFENTQCRIRTDPSTAGVYSRHHTTSKPRVRRNRRSADTRSQPVQCGSVPNLTPASHFFSGTARHPFTFCPHPSASTAPATTATGTRAAFTTKPPEPALRINDDNADRCSRAKTMPPCRRAGEGTRRLSTTRPGSSAHPPHSAWWRRPPGDRATGTPPRPFARVLNAIETPARNRRHCSPTSARDWQARCPPRSSVIRADGIARSGASRARAFSP